MERNIAGLMLQIVDHFVKEPKTIMDLGCGNGLLAKILLRTYSIANAICIDHSAPMIEQAKINMASYQKRCELHVGDFSQQIERYAEANSVDVIVSGYAIHHLPHNMKKALYTDIYKLLKPSGIFIKIEHTASVTEELEKLHDKLFIDHLTAFNKGDRDEIAFEYYSRPDKVDNILERVDIK